MKRNVLLVMMFLILVCGVCYSAEKESPQYKADPVTVYLPDGAGGLTDIVDATITTEYTNSAIAVGEVAGSATAAIFPTVTAKLVMFKAVSSNAGKVYIGIAAVTKVDGTTDITTGWELGAGEATPWIPATNLNLFYRICDNAGDDTVYMVVQ